MIKAVFRIRNLLLLFVFFILSTSFFIVSTSSSGLAQTASSSSGLVDYYIVNNVDRFVFKLNSTLANKPACNTTSRYVVNVSTESGKALKDAIINAKSNGLTALLVMR
jgi:hypothetical protein